MAAFHLAMLVLSSSAYELTVNREIKIIADSLLIYPCELCVLFTLRRGVF